jgi:uncharacterized protein GlcG (DUF336 family)
VTGARSTRGWQTAFLLPAFVAALPALAQEALVSFKSLSPEVALEMAQAAMADCRDEGYQVAVAVVDRMGVTQVVLRDRFAGPHALDSAERKAWTAASFREDTLTLSAGTAAGSAHAGVREIEHVLMLGGGIPVSVAGSVVGAVGVAGALSAEADHDCAQAGIEAIAARLELAAD